MCAVSMTCSSYVQYLPMSNLCLSFRVIREPFDWSTFELDVIPKREVMDVSLKLPLEGSSALRGLRRMGEYIW